MTKTSDDYCDGCAHPFSGECSCPEESADEDLINDDPNEADSICADNHPCDA